MTSSLSECETFRTVGAEHKFDQHSPPVPNLVLAARHCRLLLVHPQGVQFCEPSVRYVEHELALAAILLLVLHQSQRPLLLLLHFLLLTFHLHLLQPFIAYNYFTTVISVY